MQQADEEVRSLVQRLRADVADAQAAAADTRSGQEASAACVERLEASVSSLHAMVGGVSDRLGGLQGNVSQSDAAHKEVSGKFQHNVSVVWEQLRAVEGDVAAKLSAAEASQVETMAAVREVQAEARRIAARYEEDALHQAVLEDRLEGLRSEAAAALGPLRIGLAEIKSRLDDMAALKLDAGSALTLGDVHAAVARAVSHADARADNALRSIAGLEGRVEALSDAKAAKDEVVMVCDLEALLTAHAAELDRHMDGMRDEILASVSDKADREALAATDARLGSRVSSLETAILRGLKAVSDKVSGALAAKADLAAFDEFRAAVITVMSDVDRRLRSKGAAVCGQKAPADGSPGATCLSCDARVHGPRELHSMGFGRDDRVFNPERLPASDGLPLLPAILKSPDVGAHQNARATQRRRDASAMLTSSVDRIPETIPSACLSGGA
eukprot:356188-Chlamydomonas_euryale.AAC.12